MCQEQHQVYRTASFSNNSYGKQKRIKKNNDECSSTSGPWISWVKSSSWTSFCRSQQNGIPSVDKGSLRRWWQGHENCQQSSIVHGSFGELQKIVSKLIFWWQSSCVKIHHKTKTYLGSGFRRYSGKLCSSLRKRLLDSEKTSKSCWVSSFKYFWSNKIFRLSLCSRSRKSSWIL